MVNHPKEYKSSGRKTVKVPKTALVNERFVSLPTIKDRAMQELFVLATDPAVECSSDKHSFGYRVNRSAEQAILLLNEGYAGY